MIRSGVYLCIHSSETRATRWMRLVKSKNLSQTSQLFSILGLPQEVVQAVGTTVSTTSPRASFPECLEQRQRERLVKDDQRPTNAIAIRCQRVQKLCFPFHDPAVSDHEVITSESALFNSQTDGENNVVGVSQTAPNETCSIGASRTNFLVCMLKTAANAEAHVPCVPRLLYTDHNSTRIGTIIYGTKPRERPETGPRRCKSVASGKG